MTKSNRISVRQFVMIFVLGGLGLALQYYSDWGSVAGSGAWAAPVAGFVLPALGVIIMSLGHCGRGYTDELRAYGKWGSKIALAAYFIWFSTLCIQYTNVYAQRLIALITAESSAILLIILILLPLYTILRGGIVPLARFCELCAIILSVVLAGLCILLIFDCHGEYLAITSFDAGAFFRAAAGTNTLLSFLAVPFFFGDCIQARHKVKKPLILGAAVLCIACAIFSALVIGVMDGLAARMQYPFIIAVKNITVLSPLNHLEPLILAVWILLDFLSISTLSLAAVKCFGAMIGCPFKPLSPAHQLKMQRTKDFLLLLFCAVLLLAALDINFSAIRTVAPYINCALFILLPASVVFLKKAKKKENNTIDDILE